MTTGLIITGHKFLQTNSRNGCHKAKQWWSLTDRCYSSNN